jgi:two-component system chemotaxis response regulator CheY
MSARLCLVVDDSRLIRRVASTILKTLGFEVAEAENGVEAIHFCERQIPDVILLDWNMPEMDGLCCLSTLRAMKLSPKPAVIMCTTENGLSKIRDALESGADEYIMKPYDDDVLAGKLEQLGLLERA